MLSKINQLTLDTFDYKALRFLARQARITWADLASRLGVSAPAAADRVRKLEERGVIQGYTTQISSAALGYDLTAFITVTLQAGSDRGAFLAQVHAMAEIQECHHVTGDSDYLLKVRCRGTQGLERLISEALKEMPGVKTCTTVVLSTVKETMVPPLD